MCVSIFSTTFVWNISHFKKNSARYYHKCDNVSMQSTRYSWWILMKLERSRQIFEKCSNTKFQDDPSSGSRVVPYRRTDRHDETNSRFSQFWERAWKQSKVLRLVQNSHEILLSSCIKPYHLHTYTHNCTVPPPPKIRLGTEEHEKHRGKKPRIQKSRALH